MLSELVIEVVSARETDTLEDQHSHMHNALAIGRKKGRAGGSSLGCSSERGS